MLSIRDRHHSYKPLPKFPIQSTNWVVPPTIHKQTLFERLYRKKFQLLFVLLTVLILLSYVVLNSKLIVDDPLVTTLVSYDATNDSNATSANTQSNNKTMACQLPKLNPFDSSIMHLVYEPIWVDCTKKTPLLFQSTLNSTLITVANVKEVFNNVRYCCYQTLVRGNNLTRPDNVYNLSDECFPISLKMSSVMIIPPEHEYLVISCNFFNDTNANSSATNTSTPLGSAVTHSKVMDMHMFIPEKPLVESRIEEYYDQLLSNASSESSQEADNPTNILEEDADNTNSDLNVVIFGIDGVSNMNFIRIMPESYKFLTETLSPVAMQGFNKIADNTLPNLAAGLTSLSLSTVQSTCGKETAFDDCPFIWKEYAKKGYRTSYGEDSTWMGIFNYEIVGFRKPPTDYYLRPFGVAAESLIGTFRNIIARLCYGPRFSFQVLLDYMRKMAFAMGVDKRYFQFIWATSMTHDTLNYGRMGDKHLLETLKWFHEGGYFNNTMFILMSDHGIRWGEILFHHQGHVEERLPFLYFIAPAWFQEKYGKAYENLKLNQDRLTTPFDFHETLVDLLDLSRLEDSAMADRESDLDIQVEQKKLPRGISQFLPIPLSRTCDDAEIAEHYCSCYAFKEVDIAEPEVVEAANFVLNEINSMFIEYPKCANLSMVAIRTAHMMDFGYNPNKRMNVRGYELVINTMPGDAVFGTTVIQNGTGSWRISGTISRTNLMGGQAKCVGGGNIQLYCYCRDLLTT